MNKKIFSKKMRLLCSDDFYFVLKQAKRTTFSGITLFSRINQLTFPRIGLSISKKYIKQAHERNRIKRYARETFRLHQHFLLNLDFVLTIHSTEVLYLNNNNLIKELKKLWKHHYH